MTIGEKIRELRKAAGLTQAQAAARCGWGQSVWSDLETGRSPDIRLDTCRRIAEALGCKPTDLLRP